MPNLMKHLAMRRIHLKAKGCTMFHCLRDPMSNTSPGVGTRYARPGRSAQDTAFTDDETHYYWICVGKYMDAVRVYFAGESTYDNI